MVSASTLAALGDGPLGITGQVVLIAAFVLVGMTVIEPPVDQATITADRAAVSESSGRGRLSTVLIVRVAIAAAALVGGLLIGVLGALIFAVVVIVGYRASADRRVRKRREAFEEQLPEMLQMIAGSLRSGTSFLQSLETVREEAPAPMSTEIQRVLHETRLGRDLNESFSALADRMQSKDFEWVVGAFEIHRDVGGDLAEVLDRIAATIRARNRVRGQVQALSAEGRLSGVVLSLLPPGIFVAISIANPGYMNVLTESLVGWVVIGAAISLLAIGTIWLQRMARFDF